MRLRIEEWKDPNEIYSFTVKVYSKRAMRNKFTWILNLHTLGSIKEVIKRGGRFFVLLKNNKVVSIISIVKGFRMRPLKNYDLVIDKRNSIEVGAMLTDKKERGKGYSKRLFRYVLGVLKKNKVRCCYVIVTGTYKIKKRGIPRKMSLPVEKLCQKHNGKLVGFGHLSYGPIYRLRISEH